MRRDEVRRPRVLSQRDIRAAAELLPGPLRSRLPGAGRPPGQSIRIKKRIDEYQARFANPFVAAERGYIDEVILPRGTRKRIARALQMLRNKHVENPWKKHDNIPL